VDIVLAAAMAPRRERGQADHATVEVALPIRTALTIAS